MGDMNMAPPPMGEASSTLVSISAKIMVTTIIVLFFVVVFCFCLSLYAKWQWSRNEDPFIVSWRRRAARQAPAPRVTSRRRGLDRATLRSLPVIVYDPKNFKEALECAVCLSEISEGEKARLLPKCNHGFHVGCIDMWFHSHSTCPICRNPVGTNQVSSSNAHDNSNHEARDHASVSDTDSDTGSDSDNSRSRHLVALPREAPAFPTNILVWGNEAQVRSLGEATTSTAASASSSDSSGVSRQKHELVIEIPNEVFQDCLSSPTATQSGMEGAKTPVVSRLKSLKRLLSRGKRVAFSTNNGSSSADIEPV